MANPITYTIFNNSSTTATINSFTFTDAAAIEHTAQLDAFGVFGIFTGTFTTATTSVAGESEISFVANYTTTTSVVLEATNIGTIDIDTTTTQGPTPLLITNTVIYSANPRPDPNLTTITGGGANPSGGGGGGWDIIPLLVGIAIVSECFTEDTQILMADKSIKRIKDVQIGDCVYNQDRTQVNTVKFVEWSLDTYQGQLYSPDPTIKPFATIDHPLFVNGILSVTDPVSHYDTYPWLGRASKLDYVKTALTLDKIVYNLWVDGDHTYVVNGYGTTSIIEDGAFLRQSVEYGYITHTQTMEIVAAHADNGRALRVGSYFVNKFLGFINIKPVSKVIALSLAGPSTILKSALVLCMRAVGVVANLVYSLR
jgi:hypothetical protein